jgi:molybdopterin synthase sulfur carrier subunit
MRSIKPRSICQSKRNRGTCVFLSSSAADDPHQPEMNLPAILWHHLPMPKIHIPTPLRQYAGKQPSVDVKASTIGEALSGLVDLHPDLRRHLYNDEGKLRAFVNVYLNDEDVRYLQKDGTAVSDGDTISIVPSIAGGVQLLSDDSQLPSTICT